MQFLLIAIAVLATGLVIWRLDLRNRRREIVGDVTPVELTPAERDAVLAHLEDDPPDGLADLRDVLTEAQSDRSQQPPSPSVPPSA